MVTKNMGNLKVHNCTKVINTTTILQPFFQDDPGEPMPEESFFWTS